MNQGPHGLDNLCYLAGMPTRVWGWTRTRAHAIEVEDSAQAMLEFANGAPGYLYFSTVEAGAARQLQIVGDRAAIEIQGTQLTIRRFDQPLSEFRANSTEMFAAPRSHVERGRGAEPRAAATWRSTRISRPPSWKGASR